MGNVSGYSSSLDLCRRNIMLQYISGFVSAFSHIRGLHTRPVHAGQTFLYNARAMSNYKQPWLQNDANSFEDKPVDTTVEVKGKFPGWLEGSLYRNGPGIFTLGKSRLQHLFDGFSVLHRFTISKGKVTYLARVLDTDTWQRSLKADRLVTTQFGTYAYPDPCKSLLGRVMSFFRPNQTDMTDNTSVNIVEFGDRLYAMTETPIMVQVDPESLQKKDKEQLASIIAVHLGTAHPHFDSDGNMFYYGTAFNPPHNYSIIKIPPPSKGSAESAVSKAELIASLSSRWKFSISYNHSFGMSRDYFVIMEQPVTMATAKFVTNNWRKSSFFDCFHKHPQEKLVFRVIRQSDRKEVPIRFWADTGFTFHFVNCFEDQGQLVVDFVVYSSLDILDELRLCNLDEQATSRVEGCFARYVLPLDADKKQSEAEAGQNLVNLPSCTAKACRQPDGSVFLEPDFILDEKVVMELPRINYKFNGQKYRYVYGTGIFSKSLQLKKLDLETRTVVTWEEEGCMPGEPVFIPSPESKQEDEGVVLSPVLSNDGEGSCFLLILDGQTFHEIARAKTRPGLKMPVTFHGNYVPAAGDAMDKVA